MRNLLRIGNYYMLCDLTFAKGKHFVFPVPLFVLDGLLDGWWLFKHFIKYLPKDKLKSWAIDGDFEIEEYADKIVETLRITWRKFRKYGRLELLDIETKDVKVKIKLI